MLFLYNFLGFFYFFLSFSFRPLKFSFSTLKIFRRYSFYLFFFLYCFRLIVQAVERTAHNGGVVGSNPTKPS